MSFRNIARDVGSISRRSFEAALSSLGLSSNHNAPHGSSKSRSTVHQDRHALTLTPIIQESRWAHLPPELLRDVIKRLEQSENVWPGRRHVVACAAVCRSWREMCQEIVVGPEFSGRLTFPVSMKQPGPRDGMIQCFIKRDKSKLTYHLYLCLSPAVLVENGKFLLSAKRSRKTTCTEYIISMDADHISRSSSTYIGKIRSNFLGTKFIIYDTQPPYYASPTPPPPNPPHYSSSRFPFSSRRFTSPKVSPKLPPSSNHSIAQVSYELNVLGTRGPRRMHCIMHSIPASSVEMNGTVPGQPETLISRNALDESFRSVGGLGAGRSIMDQSLDFASTRFNEGTQWNKERPLVLKNKPPRWHEQLQCWCLNFRGRVTIASVKNFQLIAGAPGGGPSAGGNNGGPGAPGGGTGAGNGNGNGGAVGQQSGSGGAVDQDKIILQFGKVAKDMFTMDYRYPLSAFQAFAICLSSFDTKLACE
ncbi:hypothetical protein LUZ60_001709 [Juncus effusus]|nr:hypothetical protein LUZ60_001709 [Juncus effusus]